MSIVKSHAIVVLLFFSFSFFHLLLLLLRLLCLMSAIDIPTISMQKNIHSECDISQLLLFPGMEIAKKWLHIYWLKWQPLFVWQPLLQEWTLQRKKYDYMFKSKMATLTICVATLTTRIDSSEKNMITCLLIQNGNPYNLCGNPYYKNGLFREKYDYMFIDPKWQPLQFVWQPLLQELTLQRERPTRLCKIWGINYPLNGIFSSLFFFKAWTSRSPGATTIQKSPTFAY